MSAPTFNMFKSTTVYGAFNNLDYPDNSVLASAYFQRNLTVSGDITCSGIINGNKLYYNNVDISSTFVSNTTLNTRLNSYALLAGASFFGTVTALTPVANDISTKVATTAFVNTVLSATLTGYARLSDGATFTGPLRCVTQTSTDNTTLVATTAFVKNQNYITNTALTPYALTSSLSNYALSSSLSNYALITTLNNYALKTDISNNNIDLSQYAKLSGASFTGDVSVPNKLSVKQTSPTSSAVLEFATDTGVPRAYIYASFISNAFIFDIQPSCPNGFQWRLSGDTLMQLDFSGNITLSGATFTSGNVTGITAINSDNSNKFATTQYVKNQNYITSTALSPYALSSSLSSYALTSSLSNYALTSSLSNYALSSSLNNYALLSGATFSGTVNFNNGLTTAGNKDVHISCNNTFPSTNSGGKQGLGFFWNQTGGRGEVNLLTYGQGGAGGLSIWCSNTSNAPSKIVEFYPDFSTFLTPVTITGNLKCTGLLDSTNASGTNGQIPRANGSGGWGWSTAANTASTFVSTRVPGTITLQTSSSNRYISTVGSSSTTTIFTNTINGVSTVNIDWATTASVLPITAPLQIGNLSTFGSVFPNICPIASLNGPDPSNNLCISFPINVYSGTGSSGAKINGYGAVVKDINDVYWVVFASYANIFTQISFDPFQFTYQ